MSLLPVAVLLAAPLPLQQVQQEPDILVHGTPFLRCGSPAAPVGAFRPASDCASGSTTISSEYDPNFVYTIDVVVHVIMSTGGAGNVTVADAQRQIEILNEDFGALPGTNGAPGFDTGIRFRLATEDPVGNPTSGVTMTTNDTWFSDGGSYWNSLNWDPNRYLNIYTNSAGGALGYVPGFPQSGSLHGTPADRVVCFWDSFGDTSNVPFHLGRTATHEVGHYLGLYHTFQGGCDSAGCYSDGDLICDTNDESSPNFGCSPGSSSCGSTDPVDNYMNYSDDSCMMRFTEEQSNRMRCTLQHYRTGLASTDVTFAAFSGTPLSGEKPLSVDFTDLSSGDITSYVWDFGDGNTSTQANPTHVYVDGGLYSVSLTVDGPNGNDTTTLVDYVDVAEGPPASFVYRNGSGINPFLYLSSGNPIIGQTWNASVSLNGANTSFVGISTNGIAGFVISRGQVLVGLPTLKPLNQGVGGLHSFPIANDPALIGQTFWTQAATVQPGQTQLTNAIDITLGF